MRLTQYWLLLSILVVSAYGYGRPVRKLDLLKPGSSISIDNDNNIRNNNNNRIIRQTNPITRYFQQLEIYAAERALVTERPSTNSNHISLHPWSW